MTKWLSDLGHQWEAWLDAAAGHPTGRWQAGWRAGYLTAIARTANPDQLREHLRVAMNATYRDEYGEWETSDPLGPYGDDDTPDHQRVEKIATKLAVLMLADYPAVSEEVPR